MSSKVVIENCRVEIEMPTFQLDEMNQDLMSKKRNATNKLSATDYTNLRVVMYDGVIYTIPKAFLMLKGEIAPVLKEDGTVVLFLQEEPADIPALVAAEGE